MAAPTFVADEVVAAAKLNSLPKGTLGYVVATANQTGIGATITDLTGMTVTVTVAAGRVLRVSGQISIRQQTSTGVSRGEIRESTTVLGRYGTANLIAGDRAQYDGAVILAPAAGSHTYKLGLLTHAGTVDLEASSVNPAYIIVEDLGSV